MRFPKDHKLVTQADYKAAPDQTRKVSNQSLLILFKPNRLTHARLGLVVGKRVAKHAVDRNRIKRVIRESFRLKQHQLKAYDIIVIARQPCEKLSKSDLRKGIDKLWDKLAISHRNSSSPA